MIGDELGKVECDWLVMNASAVTTRYRNAPTAKRITACGYAYTDEGRMQAIKCTWTCVQVFEWYHEWVWIDFKHKYEIKKEQLCQ